MLDHPDITLVLDNDAVIQQVTVSNTVSGEFVKSWLGRPWIETVADSGVDKVQRSLEDAQSGGRLGLSSDRPALSERPRTADRIHHGAPGRLRRHGRGRTQPSGLLRDGIAAHRGPNRPWSGTIGSCVTSRPAIACCSTPPMRPSWCSSADDLRVTEANPTAIRALGVTSGWEFLNEMAPARAAIRSASCWTRRGKAAGRPAASSTSAPNRRPG